MRFARLALFVCTLAAGVQQDTLPERTRRYLTDLIRIDTSNPPGNETGVAHYLESVARREGIVYELLGSDPARLNFIARITGSSSARPLLLMAHSDVVPADAAEWKSPPFAAETRAGYIYGRGALDDKSLLASELAVLVELKRRGRPPARDVILLAEADEESGSSGVQWLIENAWPKIDAEFALNEGGFVMELSSGKRVYHVETTEKIPTPVLLRARGTPGHASLPRLYNPIVRVARATVKLADSDQPVRLNPTTRRYLYELSRLEEFAWLAPRLPELERPQTAESAAKVIRENDAELDAQLRTTLSPTITRAGSALNVVPGMAEVQVDVRMLPNETREEVLARMRRIVNDDSVEVVPLPGHDMPATQPSPLSTRLYQAMETILRQTGSNVLVLPYMERGATDGSFLRAKGMPVYGLPLFMRGEGGAHGADERISVANLEAGAAVLWKIVNTVTEP